MNDMTDWALSVRLDECVLKLVQCGTCTGRERERDKWNKDWKEK